MISEKISIIIRVYNVEPYIRKCLDSVINQTYKNLEVLVINNGSTDNSGAICDEYARMDSRIIVFHQENKGLSYALNIGLENFTGDYLGFVDSDDWIEPDMFSELAAAIEGVDIAVCSYYKDTDADSVAMKNINEIKEHVIPAEKLLLYPLKRDYYMGFCGYVWNKLYRAKLIRESGIFFDEEIKYAEDILFNETLISQSNCSGSFIDKPLYHYFQHSGAITKSESYDVKTDILTVYKQVEKLLPDKEKYWARGFYCHHASVICELAIKKRDENMLKKMQKEVELHYDDYKKTNREFPEKFRRIENLLAQNASEWESV